MNRPFPATTAMRPGGVAIHESPISGNAPLLIASVTHYGSLLANMIRYIRGVSFYFEATGVQKLIG